MRKSQRHSIVFTVATWLAVCLLAGNGVGYAAAAGCSMMEPAGEMQGCCCGDSSCGPMTADGGTISSGVGDHCGCITDPAPLPANLPPVQTVEKQTFAVDILSVPAHEGGLVTTSPNLPYAWPPGAAQTTLASLRVVMLLI